MDTDGNTGKNLAEVNARQQYAMQRDPTQHEAKVKEECEQLTAAVNAVMHVAAQAHPNPSPLGRTWRR